MTPISLENTTSALTTSTPSASKPTFEPNENEFPFFYMSVLFFCSILAAIPIVSIFPYVAFMMVDMKAADSVDEAGNVSGIPIRY